MPIPSQLRPLDGLRLRQEGRRSSLEPVKLDTASAKSGRFRTRPIASGPAGDHVDVNSNGPEERYSSTPEGATPVSLLLLD